MIRPDRSTWTVTFSATHMRIEYTDHRDTRKAELFILHRTRPEGLAVEPHTVQDKGGRTWAFGLIRATGEWVAWPA
jgi:hypothetical protein